MIYRIILLFIICFLSRCYEMDVIPNIKSNIKLRNVNETK